MNLSAIFSKTGKGVQEASGKTSQLSRGDRAVLSAIDGKTTLSEVQKHFEKLAGPKFEALIQQLDKDGFIREVSSGQAAAPARPMAPAAKAPAAKAPSSTEDSGGLDFTQAIKISPRAPAPSAPKPPPLDLAAAARAEAERKKKEDQTLDFRTRQELEAKAKAEAKAEADLKARAGAEARAKTEAEARAKAEAETKARAEADAKTHAEADAKVKAARDAAARVAAEAKAKSDAAEREKARMEAELNAKLDAERKAREEAEQRAAEAAERARKEFEEKVRRDEEIMRQRLEEEMKAKLEAERKAREEEDRKRREEEDRRRKEEDERRAKADAERRAREEAERKAREEEERKRREEDERRRKEDDERRAREEAERKKREEEDRLRREEVERIRREDEDRLRKEEARRAKEEAERRALEDSSRKLETERRAKEEAAKARTAADAAASLPKVDIVAPPPPAAPAAPAAGGGIGDSLLADLDSFGKREEEEQKAKEEAERKAREEAERKAKDDAERRAKEEAERKAKEEAERKAKDDAERRAKEEAERKEREEEEQREQEEAESKRKAKEAKQAEERAAKRAAAKGAGKKASADDDEIDVSEADLDKDDLKRDQKVVAERARKAAREAPPVAVATGRPKKWGKPVAITLFVLLLGGFAALNLMPLSTAEYEKAASEAMGVPVRISSARLSALTGIEVRLEGVTVGSARISKVSGTPEIGSLFGAHKSFSKIELEGLTLSQAQLSDALLGKVAGANLRVSRIVVKQITLEGPLKLPALDVEATVAGDGTLQTVRLTGADKFVATLSPKGSDIVFEIGAGSLALPFVPALSLQDFGMKGTASRAGVANAEFDGRAYDGVISGTARIRWGDSWTVEGELRARALRVAVFAPTLVSEGRVEGRGTYSMTGSMPATLYENARLQGEFKIEKGVLGSFDLSRALQTGGAQAGGRTVFSEMTGQGIYDKGAVQFSNVTIAAGGLNAGASLNIDPSGALSGRVVADVKTSTQKLGATLNISGKLQDPVIRK